jgi:hypothetical protein
MTRCAAIAILILLLAPIQVSAEDSHILNPTKREYQNELVRLMSPAPGPAGSFVVTRDGKEVPYQVERIDQTDWVWICDDFAGGASHIYKTASGKPAAQKPRVTLRKDGDDYLLDNGATAIKVPAVAAPANVPGPIRSVRLGDKWVGNSTWHNSTPLTRFSATVIGDGTLFAKVRLRYEFTPPTQFAEVDVALGPDWQHAEIFERHEMSRDDYWEFEASRGWSPKNGISKPFSGGAGSGEVAGKVEHDRALVPGGLPVQRPELYINLFPRWNQQYKDGWFFAATDGTGYVGATVVRASKWIWPHDNSIQCLVKPSGDSGVLRGSTWHGTRLWWLYASDKGAPAATDVKYVARYAWETLDKLNHEFISLEWPGHENAKAGFPSMNFYDTNQMNPTSSLRGQGRRAVADAMAGKTGDLATLLKVQVMMHPDAYGSLWNHWSPENANFFTDFYKVPIALTAQLREHPKFEELRKAAEARFREDVEHSVTLPGGAGQECPGYQAYALKNWAEMAPLCTKYLGFDPTTWERYKAAESFQTRISQPDGNVRRQLPMGDSHPMKEGGMPVVEVPADAVAKFTTQELPGFGAIFNNRAGTPQETYLAFKAGPSRGHYHGDQLAFHLCFDAHATAVDHHCSYHPRAGQEHMHNRVAFHTDDLPYANMDGYERLIAFKTSAVADVAIGQVESNRLRAVAKLPPEVWDQRWPLHEFKNGPLAYRRTIVFMKSASEKSPDYFVIRDQFWSPEPISATYGLHVLSEKMEQKGPRVDFGNLTLYCTEPAKYDFESLPWSHDNGGHEATQGARLTVKGSTGQFVTVLYPGAAPKISQVPGGVRVGNDQVTFGEEQAITITRDEKQVLTLNAKEIDLNRSQGDIGLFVPDAGYFFGDIPDWLINQRVKSPPAQKGAAK